MRSLALSLACSLLACSSSTFEVPQQRADTGAVGADTATHDDGVIGTDADEPEILPPADAGACAPLPAAPTTIYVDGRATREAVGTSECPTRTIREALTIVAALPSANLTIKVAGGSSEGPLVYNESAALVLKSGTTLVGDGPERVTITGGGPCGMAGCVLILEGGTRVEGFTISPGAARTALAVTPGVLQGASAKRLVITNTKTNTVPAVYVNGAGGAELGPEVRVVNNDGPGVFVEDIFSLRVPNTKTAPNKFNDNLAGITVKKGTLNFEGGEANGNSTFGVALLSNGKHNITGLTARENNTGVLAEGVASLRLRASTLVQNRIGLVFRFGATNDLDLAAAVEEANVFGGASASNERAGICLPVGRALKTSARNNKWASCPPTTAPLPSGAGGCDGASDYKDLWYAPIVGTDVVPLDELTLCAKGP